MSDVATLLTAIAALITGVGSSVAGIITAVRRSPREREAAAEKAVDELLSAAADGQLDDDELENLKRLSQQRQQRKEVDGK